MENTRKGLLVFVYRDAANMDSSRNGVSHRHTRFILTGPGVPEIFPVSEEHPELILVKDYILNGSVERLRAIPADKGPSGCMWGGNFVYDSDSRFPSKHPIKIHDRYEN